MGDGNTCIGKFSFQFSLLQGLETVASIDYCVNAVTLNSQLSSQFVLNKSNRQYTISDTIIRQKIIYLNVHVSVVIWVVVSIALVNAFLSCYDEKLSNLSSM